MSKVFVGRLPRDVTHQELENFGKEFGDVRAIQVREHYGFVEFAEERQAEACVQKMNGQEFLGGRIVVQIALGKRDPRSGRDRSMDTYRRDRSRDRRRSRSRDRYRPRSRDRYRSRSRDRYSTSKDRYRSRSRDRKPYVSKYPPPQRTQHRLYVSNLPEGMDWRNLKDLFRLVGEPTYSELLRHRPGSAIIEFKEAEAVQKGIEKYDGYEVQGKILRVGTTEESNRDRSEERGRESESDN